jgi:hypothetical protein
MEPKRVDPERQGDAVISLCNCYRCDYELRRIRSDAGDVKARARMTEPERRRAAGEKEFCACTHCVKYARVAVDCYASHGVTSMPAAGPPSYESTSHWVAVMLRALVLQGLCDIFAVSS